MVADIRISRRSGYCRTCRGTSRSGQVRSGSEARLSTDASIRTGRSKKKTRLNRHDEILFRRQLLVLQPGIRRMKLYKSNAQILKNNRISRHTKLQFYLVFRIDGKSARYSCTIQPAPSAPGALAISLSTTRMKSELMSLSWISSTMTCEMPRRPASSFRSSTPAGGRRSGQVVPVVGGRTADRAQTR